MDRLRRLREVATAYEMIGQITSEESSVPEDDLLDYIDSIKRYISTLHIHLIEILEQS